LKAGGWTAKLAAVRKANYCRPVRYDIGKHYPKVEVAMCDSNVGVAKQIDVNAISKDIGQLIKVLDKEVQESSHDVRVPVKEIKAVAKKLDKLVE
jgi:hypothetical protein